MTGPYQPPGGDINSPFGPSDPTSPFPPGEGSKDEPKGDNEASPYQGVQYELETPGGPPPQTPPPPQAMPPGGPGGYGPPTPPPMPPGYGPQPQPNFAPMPPKKSGGNGLLIGGVIAGVVVLLLLAGIVIVAVAVSSSGSGSSGGTAGGDDQAADTYTIPDDVCADVDLSTVEAIASFDPPASGTSSPGEYYGAGGCSGGFGTYGEDDYGYFSLRITTYDSVEDAEKEYERDIDSSSTNMGGCETSSTSGSWNQGTMGTGSSCGSPLSEYKVMLAVQDDNLAATLYIDGNADVESQGSEALKAVAESMITESKKP